MLRWVGRGKLADGLAGAGKARLGSQALTDSLLTHFLTLSTLELLPHHQLASEFVSFWSFCPVCLFLCLFVSLFEFLKRIN